MKLPTSVLVKSAEREVSLRVRVYARRVENGQMTQNQADHEIACMEAIVEILREKERLEMLL